MLTAVDEDWVLSASKRAYKFLTLVYRRASMQVARVHAKFAERVCQIAYMGQVDTENESRLAVR